MQVNLCREALCRLREHRCRARVQSVGIGQFQRLREHGLTFCRASIHATSLSTGELKQRLTGFDPSARRDPPGERLCADHQHQRHQAARMPGNVIGVEFDQRLSGGNPLPLFNEAGEALPAEVHGIKADVHQHLYAMVIGDAHGMPAGLHVADDAGHGRTQGR
ncbi:hypothetical protein D3C72_363920 [compost metagenome]